MTDPLDRAIAAVQATPVPAVPAAVLAAAVQATAAKPISRRKIPMRRLTVAAAALVLSAGVLAAGMFTHKPAAQPPGDAEKEGAAVPLEAVLSLAKKVGAAKSVRVTKRETKPSVPDAITVTTYAGSRKREDRPDGPSVVTDGVAKVRVTIDPVAKSATRVRLTDQEVKDADRGIDWPGELTEQERKQIEAHWPKYGVRAGPAGEIDGQKMATYTARISEAATIEPSDQASVDAALGLPRRVSTGSKTTGERIVYDFTDWNKAFDPAVFSLDPPAGYEVFDLTVPPADAGYKYAMTPFAAGRPVRFAVAGAFAGFTDFGVETGTVSVNKLYGSETSQGVRIDWEGPPGVPGVAAGKRNAVTTSLTGTKWEAPAGPYVAVPYAHRLDHRVRTSVTTAGPDHAAVAKTLAALPKLPAKFTGVIDRVGGDVCDVYAGSYGFTDAAVWVSRRTRLPVRVVVSGKADGKPVWRHTFDQFEYDFTPADDWFKTAVPNGYAEAK